MGRIERFMVWFASPGSTGFTRCAHAIWCFGSLLHYLFPLPLAWFGYCCWRHDVQWTSVSAYLLVLWVMLSNVYLVVGSTLMTGESIRARAEGRELDF